MKRNRIFALIILSTMIAPQYSMENDEKTGTSTNPITLKAVWLPNLYSLDLSYNKDITNDVLKQFTDLSLLDLTGNEVITDEGLVGLTNLTALTLNYQSKITDGAIRRLTQLTCLSIKGKEEKSSS